MARRKVWSGGETNAMNDEGAGGGEHQYLGENEERSRGLKLSLVTLEYNKGMNLIP